MQFVRAHELALLIKNIRNILKKPTDEYKSTKYATSVGNHKRGLRFHAQNDLPYRGQNYFLSSIVQMLLESIVRKKKEKKKTKSVCSN
jgi:hypothetical protein